MPNLPRNAVVFLAAAALIGCEIGQRPGRQSDAGGSDPPAMPRTAQTDLTATPEATSLLGEPLYPLIQDSATTERLYAQIDSAEARHEAYPDDTEAMIWLGRRYAYAGLYRDAIDVYTEGIERHPGEARFFRHRGHRYITVRELDRAVEDLEHAARLTGGTRDRVEPDGIPNEAGVPRSTLQTNIWYHLGLARYLTRDFEGAAHAFRTGYRLSPNDDMRVAMADWLWLSLKRLGEDEEAAALLAEISADMEILENDAYLRRLLVYKGALPPDSLVGGSLADADPLTVATHGYGLGAWRLVQGDETRARQAFRRVLDTGYWPAFGFIAAEAELQALGEAPEPGPEPPPRALKSGGSSAVDSM